MTFSQKEKRLLRDLLHYRLIDFVDNNFIKDLKDQKSVIGYCFFLNKVVISWSSKKQRIVSTFTIKTEYIALKHTIRKVIWIRKSINKIKLEIIKSLMLYGNNKMSIALTKNIKIQYCTKPINV